MLVDDPLLSPKKESEMVLKRLSVILCGEVGTDSFVQVGYDGLKELKRAFSNELCCMFVTATSE